MLQIKAKHQIVFVLLSCLICMNVMAQKRDKYEFYKDFPVYADKLLGQLTYPLAWGNSDIKDFIEWKSAARRKVFECMMTPPPEAKSYQVGYTLPKKWLNGTELRLSLSAQNPFTITSYSGMDPERPQIGKDGSVIETGIDGIAYPNPRTFLFGIDLRF